MDLLLSALRVAFVHQVEIGNGRRTDERVGPFLTGRFCQQLKANTIEEQ